MEAERHVDDLAAAYAAGALDETERAAVEAHARICAACLRAIGNAEETWLALESEVEPDLKYVAARRELPFERRGIAPWWLPAVAAAALIAGFLLPHWPVRQSPATLAMIQSHFSHAQFDGTPPAKVIYARDRSWYYVLVQGSRPYAVYGLRGATARALGTTQQRGNTSELFAPVHTAYDRLELRDGLTTVETAQIR